MSFQESHHFEINGGAFYAGNENTFNDLTDNSVRVRGRRVRGAVISPNNSGQNHQLSVRQDDEWNSGAQMLHPPSRHRRRLQPLWAGAYENQSPPSFPVPLQPLGIPQAMGRAPEDMAAFAVNVPSEYCVPPRNHFGRSNDRLASPPVPSFGEWDESDYTTLAPLESRFAPSLSLGDEVEGLDSPRLAPLPEDPLAVGGQNLSTLEYWLSLLLVWMRDILSILEG